MGTTEFKSYLAYGSVMSVWDLKGVLNGSCEWPGVNHTATYKCIILKKLNTTEGLHEKKKHPLTPNISSIDTHVAILLHVGVNIQSLITM